METSTIAAIVAVCFVAFLSLTYLLYELSKYVCSRIAWINWILARLRNSEFVQAGLVLTLISVFFAFAWASDINESQKEEMGDIMREKQEISENLALANLEMLALKDEKRFASQPVEKDIPAVIAETKEEKKETQEEIIAEIKRREEEEKKRQEIEEEKKLAEIQEKIDALKLGIDNLQAGKAMNTPLQTEQVSSEEGEIKVVTTID